VLGAASHIVLLQVIYNLIHEAICRLHFMDGPRIHTEGLQALQ
jgi:hypothetical protein